MTEEQLTGLLDQVARDVRFKDGWQSTADSAVPELVAEVRRLREIVREYEGVLLGEGDGKAADDLRERCPFLRERTEAGP